MAYTTLLKNLSSKDARRAGGKGASLGEMLQAGIPVPDGYVVDAQTFEAFLELTQLKVLIDAVLAQVDHTVVHSLDEASDQIQTLILGQEMPADMQQEIVEQFAAMHTTYVAVRSSATAEDGAEHAWAGQLETFLNTTQETLITHIRHCRASLFSPRALFYRFEKGLHHEHISVAVVVQKMVQSEKSGIAFSVHPVTQDRNQLIIEAGFGLGEAIVSGAVTPDSYVVTKIPFEIEDVYVAEQTKALYKIEGGGSEWRDLGRQGAQQVLPQDDIMELAALILHIENHYGFPCDIERAYEGGKFYITQSRPITTLAGDVVGIVPESTQNTSLQMPHVDGGDRQFAYNRNLSFFMGSMLALGYYNAWPSFGLDTHYRHLCFFYREAKNITLFVEKEQYEVFRKDIIRYLGKRQNMIDLQGYYKAYGKQLLTASAQVLAMRSVDARDTYVDVFGTGGAALVFTGQIGRIGLDLLQDRLGALGYEQAELAGIVQIISYPKEHTPMFDAQLGLVQLGARIQQGKCSDKQKQQALQEWLQLYEFIPVNFNEHVRTYDDAVEQLEQVLKEDCSELYERMQQNHEQKIQDAEALLQKINDEEVTRLAYALQDATYLNEYRKNIFCKISLEVQTLFKELATKIGRSTWEDFYYLTYQEVRKILAGEAVDIDAIKAERAYACLYIDQAGKVQILKDKAMLDEVRGYVMGLYESAPGKSVVLNDDEVYVHGTSANKGVVQGTVKIVMDRSEFGKFNAGDILVTSMTSVDFVPIMRLAGGFVTNEGGITSHASIVARELNKPCVIGTKCATAVFQDGDIVELDADLGIVKLISRGHSHAVNASSAADFDELQHVLPRLVKFATRWQTVLRDNMIVDFVSEPYAMEMITLPLDGNVRGFYVDESTLASIYDNLATKLKDPQRRKQHMHIYATLLEETKTFVLPMDMLRGLGKDALLQIYMDRLTWMREIFTDFVFVPFVVEHHLDPECRAALIEKFGAQQGEEMFAIISSPGELIEYQKMRCALYDQKISGNINIQALVDEFSWYSEYTCVEPLLLHEHFEKELASLSIDEAQHERDVLLRDLAHTREGYLRTCELLQDDTYVLHLADVIHTYTYLRTDRVDQFKKRQVQLRNFLMVVGEHLAQDTGIVRDLPMMTRLINSEIIDYLQKGIRPSMEEIAQRDTENYIMRYDGDQRIRMLYGKEQVHNITAQLHKKDVVSHAIKGTIAFKGKHIGRVVRVFSKADMGAVQPGDVLVARTTQPDYTPAMQKAGAIVTDEGGITSHAAIVAREIKTPCIVGTKTATLLLKTGDMVEVDAETGVVTLLSGDSDQGDSTEMGEHVASSPGQIPAFPKPATFESCEIVSEGGRASWMYIGYAFCDMRHKIPSAKYPSVVNGFFGDVHDHIHKRSFLMQDQQDFVKYVEYYIQQDSSFLNDLEDDMKRYHDELLEILSGDLQQATHDELGQICKRFLDVLYKLAWSPGIMRQLDRGVRMILETYFLDDPQKDQKIADLAVTQHLSFLAKEEIEILRLANKKKHHKKISDDELQHVYETYNYTVYGYYNEQARPLQYYIDKIDEYAAGDTQMMLEEIVSKHEEELLRRDRLLFSLPNELVPVGLVAGVIPYLKDLYKYYMNHVLYEAEHLFEAMSKMFGVEIEVLKDYMPHELIALFDGKVLDAEIVQQRGAHAIVYGTSVGIDVVTGADVEPFRKKYLVHQDISVGGTGEFYRGRVACKGHAVGSAKVILSPLDFHKFKKGDILVAMNTSPDFVAIMSMASAIVAEDGGITAHVSVVSRELGIPCVVGISHITSSVKDGEMLEVDANIGQVRKV